MLRSIMLMLLASLLLCNATAEENKPPPQKVSLQLKWLHSFQFAGYYMALEKGYYEAAGLDVTIRERDPERNNIEQVISGESQYGVADSTLLLYRAKGKPVKILASIFQHSPLVFIAKKASGIISPYQMRGKTLSYQKGVDDAPLLAMLQNARVSEDEFDYEPLDFSSGAFLRGDVDVMSAYLSNQPYFMREHGVAINIINPLNYGIDFYGDNLFTSEDEIANHPARVQAFREASIKGWSYALEHKEETIALLRSKYKVPRSEAHLRYEADVIDDMVLPDLVDIGYTSIDRFYRIAQTYERLGKAEHTRLQSALQSLVYDPNAHIGEVHPYWYITLALLVLFGIGFLVLWFASRQLKKAVADRGRLLNTTLDNIRYMVITTTKEGTITSFNREAETVLGYRAEELIGSATPALFHLESEIAERAKTFSKDLGTEIRPGFEVFVAKTDRNLPNEHEWTYVSKSGEHIKVSLSVTALKDAKGNITGYIGTGRDIGVEKQQQHELSESKAMLDEAQQIAKIGSWSLEHHTNLLRWSDEIYRIFEIDPQRFDPSYEGFLNAIHPDDVDKVNEAFSKSVAQKHPYEITHRLKMDDGRIKYVIERGYTKYDVKGAPLVSHGTVQDITEIARVEREKERYINLIDQNIIISSTDLKGHITAVSQAFCDISGYTKEELLGRSHNLVRHPDMDIETYQELWSTLKQGKTWTGEIKNRKKDGSAYWVYASISQIVNDDGVAVGYTAIRQDITDNKRVEELSVTDHLTKVYNRVHLDEVLQQELNKSERYGYEFTVILLDIDKFKSVNDTYGHQVGDSVLVETAHVLGENIRKTDILGRWGGEEFLVISPGTSMEGALQLAEKLRSAMEAFEFSTIGRKTASFGVAQYKSGDTEHHIIERADQALYQAKEEGRNRVVASS